jgi:hypothetical protein
MRLNVPVLAPGGLVWLVLQAVLVDEVIQVEAITPFPQEGSGGQSCSAVAVCSWSKPSGTSREPCKSMS